MRFRKTATGVLTLMLVFMSCLSSACAASCDAKVLGLGCARHATPSKSASSDTASMSSDCQGMSASEDTQAAKNVATAIVGNTHCLHTACGHDEAAAITDTTDTAIHFEQVYLASPAFLTQVERFDTNVSSSFAYHSPPNSPPSLISSLRI